MQWLRLGSRRMNLCIGTSLRFPSICKSTSPRLDPAFGTHADVFTRSASDRRPRPANPRACSRRHPPLPCRWPHRRRARSSPAKRQPEGTGSAVRRWSGTLRSAGWTLLIDSGPLVDQTRGGQLARLSGGTMRRNGGNVRLSCISFSSKFYCIARATKLREMRSATRRRSDTIAGSGP